VTSKIAVAVVHGMGQQSVDFARTFAEGLCREATALGDDADRYVVRPVHWAPVLSDEEQRLLDDMHAAPGRLDWKDLRAFMVHFLADVVAYQVVPGERATYDAIHGIFAETLRALAEEAGDDAVLCVVAHSLGTVIASNYLYDLQQHEAGRDIRPDTVRGTMEATPLERGRTLAFVFTLASPLALFSLRWPNRGVPVQVPSPHLGDHHPDVTGRWVNVYDRDDVIGWPLRPLNAAYEAQVAEDRELRVGSFPAGLTPLAHTHYWEDEDVQALVARVLGSA
jgi:hypothetical protein